MADTVYGNITYHFIKHQFQCFYILLPPFYKGGNRLRKIEICPIHLAKKWKRQHSNPDLLNSQYPHPASHRGGERVCWELGCGELHPVFPNSLKLRTELGKCASFALFKGVTSYRGGVLPTLLPPPSCVTLPAILFSPWGCVSVCLCMESVLLAGYRVFYTCRW